MMTDLQTFIHTTPLMDTHEHLVKESAYVEHGPDVLQDLFGLYIGNDLLVAGADCDAVVRLLDPTDPDVEGRWNGVKDAWQHCRFTGYGEAVRLIARLVYGMEELTLPAIRAAADRNAQIRRPGERLRLLKEVANLDHVQIDDFVWACLPDTSGPDFFLYDLSWVDFCNGTFDVRALYDTTQIAVTDLASLRQAMAALFAKYGHYAIAVKAQHAYERTLAWHERSEPDVERVLVKRLRGEPVSEDELLCLGDWCWARGVELAIEHNLPFKLHTGYLAGNEMYTRPDGTRAGLLGPLLKRYPAARFVLMHTAYPFGGELIAVAKHFPNVYVDLCWAWALDPHRTADFVRTLIHTVPINKVFVFGGDTFFPAETVAYAAQARAWLARALQAEIDDGLLTEAEAIHVAGRVMHENQTACFDLAGRRAAIRARLSVAN